MARLALTVEIAGRVAIVTGGASGAGRALALGLAARGAAGVAVADVDAAGAAAVAAQIQATGGRAVPVTADMTSEADVRALVAQAEAGLGPIGLVFSNAGIIVAGGEDASDAAWSKIWAVNVQSHVYVARAVVPGMLARGEGYLVITASAAGLLTQLGSAPYAVTKHAAVAFAEWLAITYGDRGIRVSALCPQAFSSNLMASSRREAGQAALPVRQTGGGTSQAAVDGVLTSEQVADCALDGIAAERFLMLPHPEVATYEQRRATDRDRWIHGMRRLQARLAGRD